jgi:hypothetical protein
MQVGAAELRSHHEMVANYDVADPIPIIDRDRKAGEPTSNKSLPLTDPEGPALIICAP